MNIPVIWNRITKINPMIQYKFDLEYFQHPDWIYVIQKRLIGVDTKIQLEIDLKYAHHREWLKNAWLWSPDWVHLNFANQVKFML